ncbi:MlaE family ABC transporter permease [Actinophytocola oryzae]|uniref:Phospholipid/cholesterol/gamma-HCH transport system permease protein n=1 Tax=Actinophytocola oryzae TaxID=502181 RepID=A0A4R7VRB4_9PSEU|nr:ABC transporter permease [Actinophytocola oryzae]TDV52330.1 phospholipid/cholesterol/gamma-HCH transport system permease protein [Actinophytocola oryzae]
MATVDIPEKAPSRIVAVANQPLDGLATLGQQLAFYARVLAWVPRTLAHYPREILRLLSDVFFGSGALAVIGGTLGVMIGMTVFTGLIVGLQGYSALNQLGTSALTGFIAAYFDTREVAPLAAGLALSATVGCGFTAQLGAMRISEEIDALEVMAVPSLPYLVTTRVIAAVAAVVPLYLVGLLASYVASRQVTVWFYGQSSGTYDHYFHLFLPPEDVLWSFLKVMVFSVVVILVHCYYGYTASGGPAGVGVAVGRAVRAAIVVQMLLDFFLSLAIWGATTTVRIAG